VLIDPAEGSEPKDVIRLILNVEDRFPVDTHIIEDGKENKRLTMQVPNQQLLNGINVLEYTQTRPGQNFDRSTPPLRLLYHEHRPGNRDMDASTDGHSQLQFELEQSVIDNGVIGSTTQVKITVTYPFFRAFDSIAVNCGGVIYRHEVTLAEQQEIPSAKPFSLSFFIPRSVFEQAGSRQQFPIRYTVNDRVNNTPDPTAIWSKTIYIDVDLEDRYRPAPIFREVIDDETDDRSTIDLAKLAGGQLLLIIHADATRFAVNDSIVATFKSPQAADITVQGVVRSQAGQLMPVVLQILNAYLIVDRKVSATYRQLRNNVFIADSRTAEATVIGSALPDLPPPQVLQAPDGVLDPAQHSTATARVQVLGYSPGDRVRLIAKGAPGPGSPTFNPVALNANSRANFTLTKAFIDANRTRVVELNYMLIRGSSEWPSRTLHLTILDVTQTPVITSVTAGEEDVADRGATYYRTLTIRGTATAGQEVEVHFDNVPIVRIPVNSNGIWTLHERVYNVNTHTVTVLTTDGSNLISLPRVFTVMAGLLDEVTNFVTPGLNGWAPGPAFGDSEIQWYFHPDIKQYVLVHYVKNYAPAGAILYKDFNNLTPGSSYIFSVNTALVSGSGPWPRLGLGHNPRKDVLNNINHHTFVPYRFYFIATRPTDRLYLFSDVDKGSGYGMMFAWFQITKIT
jgi:hypothetical protein